MSEQPTLFELSRPGRSGVEPPEPDASLPSLADCLAEANPSRLSTDAVW